MSWLVKSSQRAVGWVVLALALTPSAVFVWRNRDMPQFGAFHDDSVYFVNAKALASGDGYKISSLPGSPYQTKYPPVVPLLLSVVWRMNPQFPDNLRIATWLAWLSIPALLSLLMFYYRRLGFTQGQTWLLIVVAGLNPYLAMFGTSMMSDVLFTLLVVATLLLLDCGMEPDAPARWIAAAGIVAGISYLTRTVGLMVVASSLLYLLIRRQPRRAAVFAGFSLPSIAAWMIWTHIHRLATDDPDWIYYTDYLRYALISVPRSDWPVVLWKNLDGVVESLGSMFLPNVVGGTPARMIAAVIVIAMASGVVRMVRAHQGGAYAFFAIFFSATLVAWPWFPRQRMVLPMFPLALAGLLREAQHLAAMLRAGFRLPQRTQRIAAAVMGSVAAILVILGIGVQIHMGMVMMPSMLDGLRARRHDLRPAYEFLRASLPAGAVVYAENDQELYLYSGHPSITHQLPPMLWYREDARAGIADYGIIASHARNHGADYLFFSPGDLPADLKPEAQSGIIRDINTNPELKRVYSSREGALSVYQIVPRPNLQAARETSALK